MSKDNVVQFPYGEIRNPLIDPGPKLDHEMDVAKECVTAVINTLNDYQYYIDSMEDPLFDDLGIVLNIIHAALLRKEGQDHLMIEMMDEITRTIKSMKEELNDSN